MHGKYVRKISGFKLSYLLVDFLSVCLYGKTPEPAPGVLCAHKLTESYHLLSQKQNSHVSSVIHHILVVIPQWGWST